MIQVSFLDHVAIRCRDLEASVKWYEAVLGLKRYSPAEWGPFPIFMLAGKSGIALFPVAEASASGRPCVDHFAFHVQPDQWEKAREHLKQLGVPFQWEDHHYFHSIYFADPDGHRVELTTLRVPEAEVYGT